MTVQEIYTKYRINKGLREHMLRVAGVAEIICENSQSQLDTNSIVAACLLHDMGNLIKAKMDSMQEFFEPEGVAYWAQVKGEMMARYGSDEHKATIAILEEIDPGERVMLYFSAIGSEATPRVFEEGTLGEKIATYSDMRVGPFGVISLKERMNDLRARYIGRDKNAFTAELIDARERMLMDMETEIFAQATIGADEVTDEEVRGRIERLREWEV